MSLHYCWRCVLKIRCSAAARCCTRRVVLSAHAIGLKALATFLASEDESHGQANHRRGSGLGARGRLLGRLMVVAREPVVSVSDQGLVNH